MKGQAIELSRKTITILITAVVLVGAIFFIYQIGLVSMLGGQCGNGYCDPGETDLLCPIDCFEITAKYFMEHLVMINDSYDTYGSSNFLDSINYPDNGLTEMIDYLTWPPADYDEDCINCKECTNCTDTQEFSDATACDRCLSCDEDTGKCVFCSVCEQAGSDYFKDDNDYTDCESCFDCSGCDIEDGEFDAEHCDECKGCEICSSTGFIEDKYDCWYCSYKNGDDMDYTGCMQCYLPGFPGDSQDIRESNYCDSCKSCSGSAGTVCEDQEPWLCKRIKECIKGYNDQPCTVDEFMPVLGANGDSDDDIYTAIIDTLKKCNDETLYREFSETSKQFMCNYDKDIIFEPAQSARYDEDRTYLMCGSDISSYYNKVVYNSMTFNNNPVGMTYKLTVGGVSYFGGIGSQECRFSLYLCGQPSLLSLAMSDESTWSVEDITSTFDPNSEEEPEILDDPILSVYDHIFSMDEDEFEIGEAAYVINAHAAKEKGFVTKKFIIDFGESGATPEQIGDAIVAGLSDWIVISSNDAATVSSIKDLVTAYDDTYDMSEYNQLTFTDDDRLMNDVQWTMIEIDPEVVRPNSCIESGNQERYLWRVYNKKTGTFTDDDSPEEYEIPMPYYEITFPVTNDYWGTSITTEPNTYGGSIILNWIRNDTYKNENKDWNIKRSDDGDDWDGFDGDDDEGNGNCKTSTTISTTIRPQDLTDRDKSNLYMKDWDDAINYHYVKIKDGCRIESYEICFGYTLNPFKYGGIYYEKTDDGLIKGKSMFQIMFYTALSEENSKIILYPVVSFAECGDGFTC